MKPLRKKSQRQEKETAKDLGGKVQIASGAIWSAKADVRSDIFLVECKTTEKPFYPLNIKVWDKINKEAIRDSLRIPVMRIDLEDGKTKLAVMRVEDVPKTILDRLSHETLGDNKNHCSTRIYAPIIKDFKKSSGSAKYRTTTLAVFHWEDFINEVKDSFDSE